MTNLHKKIILLGAFGVAFLLPLLVSAQENVEYCNDNNNYFYCRSKEGGDCKASLVQAAVDAQKGFSQFCEQFGGADFVGCSGNLPSKPSAGKPSACAAGANASKTLGCCLRRDQSNNAPKDCVVLNSNTTVTLCKAGEAAISGIPGWTPAGVITGALGTPQYDSQDCAKIIGCPQATGGGVTADSGNQIKITPIIPKLQIDIPTVKFSNIQVQGTKGNRYIDIPFLAEYIRGVFSYALGFLAMLAIVMIMIGGLRYIVARGDPGATGRAKSMISNAVFGLILGLSAFLILRTVNPNLTDLTTLRVSYLERDPITIDYKAMENTVPPGDVPGAAPQGSGFNNVPVFKQGQSPWGTSPYGDCGGHAGKASYAYSACGVTSLAMVLKFYNVNVDPSIVGDFAVKNGYRRCGEGTNAGIMTAGVAKGWPSMTGERVNVQQALALLKEGKPIVLATPNSPQTCYSRGGHYIVATGIDEQGRVRINDPATCGRRVGGYNGIDGIWAGAGGVGFTAMTQQKFAQAVVGWYIHPKQAQ